MPNYTARQIDTIKNAPGCWDSMLIGVFDGDVQIGSYRRNYSSFLDTFCPFRQGEQWYALYSPDYTATRIMRLPSCEDIGGEDRAAGGFCPTGYLVPRFYRHSFEFKGETVTIRCYEPEEDGTDGRTEFESFGFVSGCIWGDDSSWKLQYLDLSRASDGIIIRDERFGYIELPENLTLEKSVRFMNSDSDEPPYGFHIACERAFRADGKAFE